MNIQLVTSIENKVIEIANKLNINSTTINIEYAPSCQYGPEEDDSTNDTYIWTVMIESSNATEENMKNFIAEVEGECSIDEEVDVLMEIANFEFSDDND